MVVDLTTPWAEWLSHGGFELGPLHLADTLARADLGLTGIGLELALGYHSPGSHRRELIDIAKMLDLYQLVNLPLHLNFAVPSQMQSPSGNSRPDQIVSDPRQWPRGCQEKDQVEMALNVMRLAASKLFVQTITWSRLCDDLPGEFQYSGLFHQQGQPKLLAQEVEKLRQKRSAKSVPPASR